METFLIDSKRERGVLHFASDFLRIPWDVPHKFKTPVADQVVQDGLLLCRLSIRQSISREFPYPQLRRALWMFRLLEPLICQSDFLCTKIRKTPNGLFTITNSDFNFARLDKPNILISQHRNSTEISSGENT